MAGGWRGEMEWRMEEEVEERRKELEGRQDYPIEKQGR